MSHLQHRYRDMNNFYDAIFSEEKEVPELNPPTDIDLEEPGGYSEANMDEFFEPQHYDEIRGK